MNPPGVGGANDPINGVVVEDAAHGFKLLAGIVADDQGPAFGQHRQSITLPAFPVRIDFMRFGQPGQMPNRPGHDIAITMQESLAALADTQHFGDVTGDRRFFGNDGDAHGRD